MTKSDWLKTVGDLAKGQEGFAEAILDGSFQGWPDARDRLNAMLHAGVITEEFRDPGPSENERWFLCFKIPVDGWDTVCI